MSVLSQQQWQLNLSCHLHWWKDGDEYVVFNAASGKTHFLNEMGAHTVRLLTVEPLSGKELINCFTALYEDFILDDDVLHYIQDMLQHLEDQGLIEAVS